MFLDVYTSAQMFNSGKLRKMTIIVRRDVSSRATHQAELSRGELSVETVDIIRTLK